MWTVSISSNVAYCHSKLNQSYEILWDVLRRVSVKFSSFLLGLHLMCKSTDRYRGLSTYYYPCIKADISVASQTFLCQPDICFEKWFGDISTWKYLYCFWPIWYPRRRLLTKCWDLLQRPEWLSCRWKRPWRRKISKAWQRILLSAQPCHSKLLSCFLPSLSSDNNLIPPKIKFPMLHDFIRLAYRSSTLIGYSTAT